ncbi:MAG: DMT family transporter [Bacteroidota bacterium]|nr:DMT family transporter [Bacteroidota bacterium]
MLYIILTILFSVFLLVVFKLFQKFEVNTFVAIIINYITAALTGILFLDTTYSISTVLHANWLIVCVPLGLLFITIFYLISQTAQRISVSTASVANKMSVAMPVLFSVIFLNQQLSVLKIIGIVLALVAVYFSTKTPKTDKVTNKLLWLPIAVFIGSGLIDISINATNAFYISSPNDSALFSITTFLSAFCCGLIIVLFQFFVTKKQTFQSVFKLKNIVGGIVLGIPNYFSIYFIFKSLDAKVLSSAQLFPILNLSNVALSALVAWLLFKEKLSVINIVGICLAVVAIVLISF